MGVEHVAHVGYISGSEPDGHGQLRVRASGPGRFLAAAVAIAHVYIGFAVLAETATASG
jgi:hypothetical protein